MFHVTSDFNRLWRQHWRGVASLERRCLEWLLVSSLMNRSVSPSCPPSMPDPKTQFTDLPLEIRDIIWDFVLPPPRVFQVRRIGMLRPQDVPPTVYRTTFSGHHETSNPASRHFRCFEFQRKHPPPIATQICRESRAAALRAGYFLFPTCFTADIPRTLADIRARMVWFGGPIDLLYFTFPANNATMEHGWGHRPVPTPCLSLVKNVGVEWVYFFQGTRAPPHKWASSSRTRHWQGHVLPLYEIPAARRHFWIVFPAGRSANTEAALGREPVESFELEARITPMPPSTNIPLYAGDYPWSEVRQGVEDAIAHRRMRRRSYELFGDDVWYQPEVRACILSRVWSVPDLPPVPCDSPEPANSPPRRRNSA